MSRDSASDGAFFNLIAICESDESSPGLIGGWRLSGISKLHIMTPATSLTVQPSLQHYCANNFANTF
jgi:hypothetical protein